MASSSLSSSDPHLHDITQPKVTWLSATTLDISIISAHQGSRTEKLPGQAGPTLDTLSVLKVRCGIRTWDF